MTQMQIWRDIDISAYVDGELDPTSQAAFETALAQDRTLRRKVDELREVVTLVRAVPLREPPRNYLLTPSMVAEKTPQRTPRRPVPLLFMRLATSLAAVAFVVTTGLTYMQRSTTPKMLMHAPTAFDEMPALEAPQAIVATVEVEAEVKLASEPGARPESAAIPEPAARVEENVQAEKVVESEEVVETLAQASPTATPQPDAGAANANTTLNTQEQKESPPPEAALALESVPATRAQIEGETGGGINDSVTTNGEVGEREWRAYDTAAESAPADDYGAVTFEPLQTPSWRLPVILGALTLLLAGITYWISRRR